MKLSAGVCRECIKKRGFVIISKGAHTCVIDRCAVCKAEKSILPDRHWVHKSQVTC